MTTIPDSEIISMIASGGSQAEQGFLLLYKEYASLIKYRLRKFGVKSEDLDDIFQETCLKLIKASRTYAGGSVVAWITRIAKNIAIDHHRKTPDKDRYVLVSPYLLLKDLPNGATICVSTISQQENLIKYRHDLIVVLTNDDVKSRINSLDQGTYDALILRSEDLEREKLKNRIPKKINDPILTAITLENKYPGDPDSYGENGTQQTSDSEKKFTDAEIEDCMENALKKFQTEEPARCYAIELQRDGCSIEEISALIERSLSATKEFISQSKKKLKPYIQPCFELLRQ